MIENITQNKVAKMLYFATIVQKACKGTAFF